MSNHSISDLNRFAEMFGALANPHRLAIFLRLATCCPSGGGCTNDEEARRYVGELGVDLEIAPSTVSHHIKELRRAGLLRVEREGQRIACWVDPETRRDLAAFFSQPPSPR